MALVEKPAPAVEPMWIERIPPAAWALGFILLIMPMRVLFSASHMPTPTTMAASRM